jgi:hypothetical protein
MFLLLFFYISQLYTIKIKINNYYFGKCSVFTSCQKIVNQQNVCSFFQQSFLNFNRISSILFFICFTFVFWKNRANNICEITFVSLQKVTKKNPTTTQSYLTRSPGNFPGFLKGIKPTPNAWAMTGPKIKPLYNCDIDEIRSVTNHADTTQKTTSKQANLASRPATAWTFLSLKYAASLSQTNLNALASLSSGEMSRNLTPLNSHDGIRSATNFFSSSVNVDMLLYCCVFL